MTWKTFFTGVFASLVVALTSSGVQAQHGALNYQQAELRQVIKDVAVRTGRTFIVAPNVKQTVTIYSPEGATLTPNETWELFLATLQVSGLAAVPVGPSEYKIIASDRATREGGAGFGKAGKGEYVTRIMRLTYVDSRTAANSLKALVSDRAVVTPVVESNSLIIVDTKANMDRLAEVVRRIDTDTSIVRTVKLINTEAAQVADTLRKLSGGGGPEAGRRTALSIVAVNASNSLILRGAPAEVKKILPIIAELDETGVPDVDLGVVYLNHADAEEIVPLLKDIIDSSYIASETAGGGRKPSISAHKQTNALIINADADTQKTIKSVIRQLDIRQAQVQIEAIIVDISETAVKELGIQYILSGTGDNSVPFIANSDPTGSPNIFAAAGAAYFLSEDGGGNANDPLVTTIINSLIGTGGLTIGGGGQNSDGTIFGAILNAVQSDNDSRVLSTPSLTVLDNEPATLSSGQNVPITAGETLGQDLNNVFRTIERKDVGVILEVTPQISDDHTIRMKIRQEVSGIQRDAQSAGRDIIINKSELTTVTRADDGQILVIGGLIRDAEEYNDTKIPYLGDIPVAGNLFKSSSKTKRNSTLMVFIRPTILDDRETADAATARKYNYVRGQELMRYPVGKAEIDRIVEEYLGTGFAPTIEGFKTGGRIE